MKHVKVGRHIGHIDETAQELIDKYFASQDEKTSLQQVVRSPNTRSPFRKWDPSRPGNYERPIVVFDTETGAADEVLSIGAVKLAFNKITRQFEQVDTFERYYYAKDTKSPTYRERLAIHDLSQGRIKELRKKASYSKYYDASQQVALREFIGDAIISGHNVEGADIKWALGSHTNNSVIDTLIVMENMRGAGGNKLNEVFQDLFGRSMEASGLGHHDAMADTYATALILGELLKRQDVTGASLRYVLHHKGTSIAPLDTPDQYGSTGVVWGPYRGYLRDPGYYISRRNLFMASEFKDPETGKLIPGMHWDDESSEWDAYEELRGGRRIARTEHADVWAKTFSGLAGQIANSAQQIATTLRDLSGSAAIDQASARPRQISFLSNFASRSIPWEENQRFQDAAQALHIPTADWSAYYKSAVDYAEAKGKNMMSREEAHNLGAWENELKDFNTKQKLWNEEWIAKRLRDAGRAEDAYKSGKITKAQYDQVIVSTGDVGDALDKAIEKTQLWTGALHALNNVPVFDPARLIKAYGTGLDHVYKTTQGILPSFLRSPLHRAMDISTTNLAYQYEPWRAVGNATQNLSLTGGGIGTAIGTVIGGPPGALIGEAVGSGIGGSIALLSQVIGNAKEAQINRRYQQMSMGMNVVGIGVDLLLMPFKALAASTKLLVKGFSLLSSQIGSMSSLGNPLTTLTGVNYPHYQGLEIAEGMLGLGKGTLNSTIEDYARQKELLYTTGHYDEKRLVAASMLGVFDDVYGGGNYEHMVSSLAQRNLTASDIALVSQLDKHTAQVLEVMKAVGATSLSQLANPTALRGIYFKNITDPERTRLREDAYEWGAIKGSMSNSVMRIVDRLWRSGGKGLGDTFNRILGKVADGGSWKEAWGEVKEALKGNDLWNTVKEGLSSLWSGTLLPKLTDLIATFADTWLSLLDSLVDRISPLVDRFMNTIMNIELKGDPFRGYSLGFKQAKGYHYDFSIEGMPLTTNGGKQTREQAQKTLDMARKYGKNYVYNAENKAWMTVDQAQAYLDSGFETWEDFKTPFETTAHSYIGATRTGVQYVARNIPEVLETIQQAIQQIGVDLKTTLEITINKDGRTISQEVNGDSGTFSGGGVTARVFQTKSMRGR